MKEILQNTGLVIKKLSTKLGKGRRRFIAFAPRVRALIFILIFALTAAVYLLVTNYAQDNYGNVPTAADQIVLEYQIPEPHKLLEKDIEEGEVISGVLLYGNGLMLCGPSKDELSKDIKINAPYYRNLSPKEVKGIFDYLRENGFDDLHENLDPKSLDAPVEALSSITLNTDKGSRRVNEPTSLDRSRFDALVEYLNSECAKTIDVYDSDEVIVETIKLKENGSSLPSLPADLIELPKKFNTKKAQVISGEKGKELKEKVQYGLFKYKAADGKTVKVRLSPQIPAYQPPISVKWRTDKSNKGKAFAQSSRSVRFLYVVAADQATPASAQADINDSATTLPNYYEQQVGRRFVTSEVAVVRGSKTAGQYQTCPANRNCSGSATLAAYYNLQDEFRRDGVNTIIRFGWGSPEGCLGLGGPVGNIDSADYPYGLGISSAVTCHWTDARHSMGAHEGGHGFGLVHTCDSTMMRDSDPQRNCPPKSPGYGAPLNSVQAAFLRDRSPYFTAVSTPANPCATVNAKGVASKRDLTGYWYVTAEGRVSNCGTAGHFGDMSGRSLAKPIVGMAASPSGNGYWLVASDGGIFAFGDATFKGSMGGTALSAPIVSMAAHPTNGGYWLVASDGGIFAFGVGFYGSMGGKPLNKPIVGMASSSTGNGYWMFAGDGGLFAFGDATFHGSTGNITLNQPIVAMAPNPGGGGYWLVASDGGLFAFGSATFFGSAANEPNKTAIIGMVVMPDGRGYTIMTSSGQRFQYGTALGGSNADPDPLSQPKPPLPNFKTSITYTSAWSQHRKPTGVQMTFYTAWDGGVLPGYCAQIHESSAPWEYTWMDNQLCTNIDLGLTYTSAWPAGQPIPGNCVNINEPSEPAQHTWSDNVLCTNKVDIGMRWSYNGSLADENTDCVLLNESSDPYSWGDNYLCWNKYWPGYYLDPIPAGCVQIYEPSEPWEYTWNDNVLCAQPDIGLSYTSSWSPGEAIPANCVRMIEPSDPYSWNDNVLCSNTFVDFQWSYNGNLDDADTDCVSVYEPSDPHTWMDNYLCWYDPPAGQPDLVVTDISWAPASPQTGNQVIFTATIMNKGTAATPGGVIHGVSFMVGNTLVGWNAGSDASLAAGATRTVISSSGGSNGNGSWTAAGGNHTVEAFVDDANRITNEIDENNNKLSKNITVTIPNQAPTAPINLRATGVTSSSISLAWNASTDDKAVKEYRIYRNNALYSFTTQLTFTDNNVVAGTNYTYQVSAIDFDGAESAKSNQVTITAQVPIDAAEPSPPGNLTATAVSSTQVNLTWSASTDDVGVVEYYIYRGETTNTDFAEVIAIVSGTTYSYVDNTASPGKTYTYSVRARDAADNYSGFASKSVTTPAVADTTPPTAPTNLTVNVIAYNQVNLSWTASTDNVGVVRYDIYRNGAKVGTSTTTSFGDGTTAASTNYTYYVTAFDAAGNTKSSGQVSVTTPAASSSSRAEDINEDGVVNLLDFVILKDKYGQTGPNIGRADINRDGIVSLIDFVSLKAAYGT